MGTACRDARNGCCFWGSGPHRRPSVLFVPQERAGGSKPDLIVHPSDTGLSQTLKALVGLRGDGGTSHDQSRDEGAKESFASASGVVHELEEAEIERQLLLRDAPVWPQPGA